MKTENGMTGWEKLQRERGAVFYSDVPREPQFQVGQMVWWEGKEYQVEHATELRINIELPDGTIKSVQNEEIAIKNWQVGDRCFVISASESGEVLELCNDSLTFRVRLDSIGEIGGYWANDLVLDPAAPLTETIKTTVEPAVEATPVTQKKSQKSRQQRWQVGDLLVADDCRPARIIRIDEGITFPLVLQFDNGRQRHYSADDLKEYGYRKVSPASVEFQQVSAKLEAPGADTISTLALPETTTAQAIEATEVINPPPTDEGDSVKQQQAELNAFGAKLSAKYNELERLLPSKTSEAAPPTGKFKVGDRVRSHDQIGTILKVDGESLVTVHWDGAKAQVKMNPSFLSAQTAEGGELLPAPRGVVNYLSLKPGDRVRILRHAQHKKSWWEKGGMVVTIKATRINPRTNELEANAEIAGEGLPCTLSLDAVEVVN